MSAERWAKAPQSMIMATVDAPPWTLHVYLYLDSLALTRGWWETSQGAIASDLGITRQAVNAAVRWLTARGDVITARVDRYVTRFEMSATRTPHTFGGVTNADTSAFKVSPTRTRGRSTPLSVQRDQISEERRGRTTRKTEGQQLVLRDAEGALARLAAVQRAGEKRRGWPTEAELGPTERTDRTPLGNDAPMPVAGALHDGARRVAGT